MFSQNRLEVSTLSFSEWVDYFNLNDYTTAADLETCRTSVGQRYPEMVLWLARHNKLRPKVLADATYTAWLKADNPKKCLPAGDWADLFRRSHQPGAELFEVQSSN